MIVLSYLAEKRRFMLVGLLLAFAVSGCASRPAGVWVRPGATPEEVKSDFDHCMFVEYESKAYQSSDVWSAAMADIALGGSRLKTCMQNAGYTYVIADTSDIRLGLGYTYKNGYITNLVDGAPLQRAGFAICDQIEQVGNKPILYDSDLLMSYSAAPLQFVTRRGEEKIEKTVQPEVIDFSKARYVYGTDAICPLPKISGEPSP